MCVVYFALSRIKIALTEKCEHGFGFLLKADSWVIISLCFPFHKLHENQPKFIQLFFARTSEQMQGHRNGGEMFSKSDLNYKVHFVIGSEGDLPNTNLFANICQTHSSLEMLLICLKYDLFLGENTSTTAIVITLPQNTSKN